MMVLAAIVIVVLFELFNSSGLVQLSRGFFRLSILVSLMALLFSNKMQVQVGSAMFFGVSGLVALWSLRSEVQCHDDRS